MVRAVLFDLDDTLVDHQHANRAAVAGVRDRFLALQRVPLDDLVAENTRLLNHLHRAVALGTLAVDAARVERYRSLFAYAGANGDAHAAAAARTHRTLYSRHRRPVAGALELLQALSPQVAIAVVTNNPLAEQSEKLSTFGLAEHVAALVTSEQIGVAKPDPRIFGAALARLECAANDAVMIGDSLDNDVGGALAAGIAAVWFDRSGAPLPANLTVPVLTSLEPATEVARRILTARLSNPLSPEPARFERS
jgi:HAD superfamily hydrolase (TIGR01509 family)